MGIHYICLQGTVSSLQCNTDYFKEQYIVILFSTVQYCTVLYTRCQGLMVEKKSLYEWKFKRVHKFDAPTMVEGDLRGRYRTVSKQMMKNMVSNLPDMSLQSTTKYFVERLSASDRNALMSTMKKLDGKCITIGSTCSGTDVIIPVMHWTFDALSQMFDVACF